MATVISRPGKRAEHRQIDLTGDDRQLLVHNRTPREIELCGPNDEILRLSPLGQRVMKESVLQPFLGELRKLQREHHVAVRPYIGERQSRGLMSSLVALGLLAVVGAAVYGLFWHGSVRRLEVRVAWAAGAALIIAAMWRSYQQEQERRRREVEANRGEGDIDFGAGEGFYTGNETIRQTRQYSVLGWVLLIGALLPAVAIVVATDTKGFMNFEAGFYVKPGFESRFVARVIQLAYVAVLSVFPALMYFQFDRQRVGTIRGQWIRNIFRIDRRMQNLSDVNARYGALLSEASYYSTDTSRVLGGRRSPIVVATILMALGWTILVARTESFDFERSTAITAQAIVANDAAQRSEDLADAAGAAEGAAAAANAEGAREAAATAKQAQEGASKEVEESATGTAADTGDAVATQGEDGDTTTSTEAPSTAVTTPIDEAAGAAAEAKVAAEAAEAAQREIVSTGFFQLLLPDPTPAGMAFLGAYFFAIYLILRAYLRGDLRPKAYNQITARLVTVVVVAYLISVLIRSDDNVFVLALAFLAGVIPSAVLRRLGEITGGNPALGTLFGQAFGQERPLTDIDGIDIYERERLSAEGVTDIEALAHAHIVNLMVNSRIPMERLVDWVDQAVLILHLGSPDDEKLDKRVYNLRLIGIRTASSVCALSDLDEEDPIRRRAERILGEGMLPSFKQLLEREPVMQFVYQWRHSPLADPTKPALALRAGC